MGTAGTDANDQLIQSGNDAITSDDVSCTEGALVSSGRRLETVDAATGRRQLSVSATFRLTYVFSAAFLAANGGNVETAINAAFDDIQTAITSGALQTALVNNLVGITVTVDQAASLVTLQATRVTALVPYTSSGGDDSDDSLTDGEIAGIVVGSVAGAGLLGGGAFFAVTKMKGPKGGVAPDY